MLTASKKVAYPPLFAQNQIYQGDLSHLEDKRNIQWWLNWFVRMYEKSNQDKARLPYCLIDKQSLEYIRFGNIFVVFIL